MGITLVHFLNLISPRGKKNQDNHLEGYKINCQKKTDQELEMKLDRPTQRLGRCLSVY